MKSAITIGIAEPDQPYRALLVKEICSLLDRKVQFCASNGKELIDYYNKNRVDVLVVNLYMPVISGIEVIKLIRQVDRQTKILAISSLYQADVSKTLPVDGYCSRNLQTVHEGVNHLLSGGTYFDQQHFQAWEKETYSLLAAPAVAPYKDLKPVEISIIHLTYEGRSNKEIAVLLSLSKRTIDTYVRDLLIKLGLKTKMELVVFAVDHGICKLHCAGHKEGHCVMESCF